MSYTSAEKAVFTQSIQKRFKTFVVRLIRFCELLPASPSRNVINYQIIKLLNQVVRQGRIIEQRAERAQKLSFFLK